MNTILTLSIALIISVGINVLLLVYLRDVLSKLLFLSENLDPQRDVCHRAILMHEIIHVLQEEQKIFA